MSKEDSILDIIKQSCKKCFKTETSTEAGRVNLLSGIIIVFVFVGITSTTIFDFILIILNKDRLVGLPWYAILILASLVIVFFAYCIKKVSQINLINEEKDSH